MAVKVLMHEDNAEKLNSVLAMLNRELPKQIIPLGRAETMFRVAEALSRNEIVGLLADRVVAGDKMLRCNFLDADAPFPEGPFILASVLKAPVVLFSAIYCGGRRYRISFEPFVDSQSAALERTAIPCSRRFSATRTGSLAAASPLLTTGSISMIFGPMSNNAELTWSRRLSLVLALIAMTPAAGAFDMAELMTLMARVETSSVAFEETKQVAALTAPIVRRGTLRYDRPDHLEMRVETPYFERMDINGNTLTIESKRGIRQVDLASDAGPGRVGCGHSRNARRRPADARAPLRVRGSRPGRALDTLAASDRSWPCASHLTHHHRRH